jgi:hypothetical protein
MPLRLLSCIALLVAPLFSAETAVEFNRDVRPILSDKCFTCHGPDAASKKVPFRLDREELAKADLGNGRHAIVNGDLAASEMVRRITAPNKAMRMPPVYSGLQLSDREIDILRRWIAQGAKWDLHWSFIPPKRPPLPEVKNAAWARNPIDRFILARLERELLTPAPEAAPATLLRRVSLDLTGLPPSPSEVDALLSDRSPGAYERAVDRLLASPRYGERMAARWLDAARYADTNGYQYDGERTMWRWRDWVIESFNRNEPYDRFAVEQLAGDLLPNARLDQQIATGFNRNHRINTEDGIVPEEYFVEQVVDRVETTSTVFLGVTLGCARCHNHKYDPFTQKEFYQFYAYFNSLPELGRGMKYGNTPPLVIAPTAEQQKTLASIDERIREAQKFLTREESKIAREEQAWERTATGSEQRRWVPEAALEYTMPGDAGAGSAQSFDGKRFVDAGNIGASEIGDPFSIAAWIRSEGVPDGSIASRMADNPKGKGHGVHLNQGHVHVNLTSVWADDAIRMESEESVGANAWHHIAVTYDGSRIADGVKVFIDGVPAKMRIELATLYRPFGNAGKKFAQPFRIGAGWGPERRFRGQIGDFHLYSRVLDTEEVAGLALDETVAAIAGKPERERSAVERNVIRSEFFKHGAPAEIREVAARIAALKLERAGLERTFPTVMVMRDLPQPRETHLLVRGAYDKPGDRVERGVPAVLPPFPSGVPNNRLGLAQWIASPQNPLTARVAVNRMWQMLFGNGLVKTVEDFGVQGEWPSHPELLDWLATEFVNSGWNVKAMLRLMVTSAAYRQASTATPELVQRDPENRLLARGPRFRLSAEMIRDQALFDAGLLVEKIGGPSVKPYQPAGLWKETSMQDMDYVQSHGPDLYRRSLYTFWKRTIAPPMMINFDAAGRETCVVRETRTNTPLQALDLMNDVTFVEAARMLGQRMIREGGSDAAARLRYGFRIVTARAPLSDEQRVLEDSLRYQLDYFASNPGAANKMITQGETPADSAIEARQLAAYAAVGSLLLNLDEAVTKE